MEDSMKFVFIRWQNGELTIALDGEYGPEKMVEAFGRVEPGEWPVPDETKRKVREP